jgi:hypothetical protein
VAGALAGLPLGMGNPPSGVAARSCAMDAVALRLAPRVEHVPARASAAARRIATAARSAASRPPRGDNRRGMPARRALVVLIVAATAVLVVGVALERDARTHEALRTSGEVAPVRHAAESGVGSEAGETGESTESGTVSGAPPRGERVHEESSERLLGVDPESTGVLALAVVASLALAAAVWRTGTPWLLGLVAVVMVAFAALDVREVVHQIGESRAGLTILAALVAALHLAAAALAARGTLGRRRAGARPAAA